VANKAVGRLLLHIYTQGPFQSCIWAFGALLPGCGVSLQQQADQLLGWKTQERGEQ
jgi:hypothetical protein